MVSGLQQCGFGEQRQLELGRHALLGCGTIRAIGPNPANWSANSGGVPGASVPSAASIVTFDANGAGACTLDVSPSINQLSITSGYAGTFSAGVSTITLNGSLQISSAVPLSTRAPGGFVC